MKFCGRLAIEIFLTIRRLCVIFGSLIAEIDERQLMTAIP